MELNEVLDKKLTSEQKARYQRDDGHFKILKNIFIIPIITAILGIYLESIIIVTISIICIIVFLLLNTSITGRKNKVYEDAIIPYVLEERFSNIEKVVKDDAIEEEFNKSNLCHDYDKLKSSSYFRIIEDNYVIHLAKIVTKKVNIEENDGVVDKSLDQNFSGIFAYVKLPSKFENEFTIIKNEEDKNEFYKKDKTSTEYLKMNNLEFDMQYNVFSMDQVSVKKLLSPGVMARILDINKKINNVINFSVYNNVLYITLDYDNFLEFKGNNKEYVDEEKALENLNVLEALNYFVRYVINMIET